MCVFFSNSVKINQPILIILLYNVVKKLDTGKYKCAHFTYKLLPHYLGKCTKVIFQLFFQQ